MSSRRLISSGSSFEAVMGYSRAVVDGSDVFVSGTTGFDYATMTISDDPVVQTRQCGLALEWPPRFTQGKTKKPGALSRAGFLLGRGARI